MAASNFEKLEAGKPYPGDVPKGDSVRVDMTDGGLVAYIVYDGITDKKAQDVRTGEAQFALTVKAEGTARESRLSPRPGQISPGFFDCAGLIVSDA